MRVKNVQLCVGVRDVRGNAGERKSYGMDIILEAHITIIAFKATRRRTHNDHNTNSIVNNKICNRN